MRYYSCDPGGGASDGSRLALYQTLLSESLSVCYVRMCMRHTEGLRQWPENMPLENQPTKKGLTGAICSMANGKDVGPDGVSVELLKITLNGDLALRRKLLGIVVYIWRGGEVPQQWKDAIIMVHHKKKD